MLLGSFHTDPGHPGVEIFHRLYKAINHAQAMETLDLLAKQESALRDEIRDQLVPFKDFGFSIPQIARYLDVPVGQLRQYLRRSRKPSQEPVNDHDHGERYDQ